MKDLLGMQGIVTYAGGRRSWKRAGKRISRQMKNLPLENVNYTVYSSLTEVSLLEGDRSFIQNNAKGHGYWIWKPLVILDYLAKNPDISKFLYLDAGCDIHANPLAIPQFDELWDTLNHYGVVAFEMQGLLEKHWSKKRLFQTLDPQLAFAETNQLAGTLFAMRRDFAEVALREWHRLMQSEKHSLLIDTPRSAEEVFFIEHRHDQSIFSLLMKSKFHNQLKILDFSIFSKPESCIKISRNRSYFAKNDIRTFVRLLKILERVQDVVLERPSSIPRRIGVLINLLRRQLRKIVSSSNKP